MAISVADNFSYQGTKPLDGRTKYATVAAMKAASEATLYDGIKAYVDETDKYYKFLSSNTSDTTTGKWREDTGGAGTTPVITATATADATSSASPTVLVTKTGTDAAPNFDFAFSGLKGAKGDTGATGAAGATGVGCKNYSTSEQDTGLTWINGKKIYQKTIAITIPTTSDEGTKATSYTNIGANIDLCIELQAFAINGNSIALISPCWKASNTSFGVNFAVLNNNSAANKNTIQLQNAMVYLSGCSGYATLKYTKA